MSRCAGTAFALIFAKIFYMIFPEYLRTFCKSIGAAFAQLVPTLLLLFLTTALSARIFFTAILRLGLVCACAFDT